MSCCPNPIHCILPPYILDHLAESSDPKVRKLAVDAIARSATLRATRTAGGAGWAGAPRNPPATHKKPRVEDKKKKR